MKRAGRRPRTTILVIIGRCPSLGHTVRLRLPFTMFLSLALGAWLPARSVSDIADKFTVPPAFSAVKQQKERGIALISQRATRTWVDPFGLQLGLAIDDTNVISPAYVSAQRAAIIEQARKFYPREKLETSGVFNIKGHNWIVVRLHGVHDGQDYLRIFTVGEFQGYLMHFELAGPSAWAGDIARYLRWTIEDNSPESPANASGQPSPAAAPEADAGTPLSSAAAILLAHAAAPKGIDGRFEITVRGTGLVDGTVYLNSEIDYRARNCLTVRIPPVVAAEFRKKYGGPPEVALKGKRLRLAGEAHRITIDLTRGGMKTGHHYYQTHIRLLDLRQIEAVEAEIPAPVQPGPAARAMLGTPASDADAQPATTGKPHP